MDNDFTRFSKRVVQYIWDPPPRNDDPSVIWCLGRRYHSRYDSPQASSASASSDSATSQADSAVVTEANQKPEESAENGKDERGNTVSTTTTEKYAALSPVEEEALGWPADFLNDLESRIWLSYRSNFPPIPKSQDPAAASAISFTTKLRYLGTSGGFTSDTGWGCMIRSGQSLLANTLAVLKLGREWRLGQKEDEHRDLLALFADVDHAPFSIHHFVEHGARACGKHPGEWFGPSATARSIQALTDKYSAAGLRVYARPDDGDVYVDSLLATATQKDADDVFQPTLILLGIRLGIDRVTPVYHAALKAALEMPHSVGIAGGRPSSSHYFIGHQNNYFFYLDPHTTRRALPQHPSAEDVASCHTRRLRRLNITEMDPSMLLGFLVRSQDEFEDWRSLVASTDGKAIIHVHDREPKYATGTERSEAVDEVETWDEATGDEDVGDEC